jgi:hypothetical protein
MPKIWTCYLVEKESIFSEINILNSSNPEFISKGAAFEVVFQKMVILRCNFHCEPTKASEAFFFLKNTCLQDLYMTKLSMFKLTDRVTKDSDISFYDKALSIPGCVLVKSAPQSSSEDMAVLFPQRNFNNIRPLLSLQLKNWKDPFGLSDLQSEVNKSELFVEACRMKSKSKRTSKIKTGATALLVIALTGPTTEGRTGLSDIRGRVLDTRNAPEGLKIPSGMQVLVLTQQDVSKFIGWENFQALKEIEHT